MFEYGDLIRENKTGKIAKIEYGSNYSPVYCIKFFDEKRFQINAADLEKRFKKVHAICPKCGHHMVKSDLPDYSFLCENCDENFYSMEVKQYV